MNIINKTKNKFKYPKLQTLIAKEQINIRNKIREPIISKIIHLFCFLVSYKH